MLRNKHGSKYAILFSHLNVFFMLIRSCHFLTHAVPCVGEGLPPPQLTLLKVAVASMALRELLLTLRGRRRLLEGL